MKVVVIADSHGMANRILRVVEEEKDLNVLVHLGDGLLGCNQLLTARQPIQPNL
jgi:predicted phosphodiesterase